MTTIKDDICVDFKSATKAELEIIGKILLANYKNLVDEMILEADYATPTLYWPGYIPLSFNIMKLKDFINEYENLLKDENK